MEKIQSGYIKTEKQVAKKTVVALLIFLLMVSLFAFITYEIFMEGEVGFDKAAFAFLKQFTTLHVTIFFTFLTFFGSTYFLLLAYLVTLLYFLAIISGLQYFFRSTMQEKLSSLKVKVATLLTIQDVNMLRLSTSLKKIWLIRRVKK